MLIPTTKNVKTITDMREDALGLLELVQKNGLAYIFHRSQPRAVLMNIEDFISLQNVLEDFEDFQDVEKLKKEPRGKGVPLAKIIAENV